jgi:hypothetical protein
LIAGVSISAANRGNCESLPKETAHIL